MASSRKSAKRSEPRDPEKPLDFADMWSCEECLAMYEGVNPPDFCVCGHQFFDNVCDLLRETNAVH